MNMSNHDGFPLRWLHNQAEFEAAVYHLPGGIAEVPTFCLLYSGHQDSLTGRRRSFQRIQVDEKSCFLTCVKLIHFFGGIRKRLRT